MMPALGGRVLCSLFSCCCCVSDALIAHGSLLLPKRLGCAEPSRFAPHGDDAGAAIAIAWWRISTL